MTSRSSRCWLLGALVGLRRKPRGGNADDRRALALEEATVHMMHAGRALLDAMLATTEEQQASALTRTDQHLALAREGLETARLLCRDEEGRMALARLEPCCQDYSDAVTTLRANAMATTPDERGDVAKYLFANFARVVGSTTAGPPPR